jgi:hypothetical protein
MGHCLEELGEFVEILPPAEAASASTGIRRRRTPCTRTSTRSCGNGRGTDRAIGRSRVQEDYSRMLRFHQERHAAATLARDRGACEEGRRCGVVAIDEQERIIGFEEKPAFRGRSRGVAGLRSCVDGSVYLRYGGARPRDGGRRQSADDPRFRPGHHPA